MKPKVIGQEQSAESSDSVPERGAVRMGSDRAARGSGEPEIVSRTAKFADRIIQLCLALPNHCVGWEIGRQLVRAGMSVGANVEEAQAAESKADFIHKMRIARKECREARFFLGRISKAELVAQRRLGSLQGEAGEIVRVLTTIILRAAESDDRRGRGD